MKYYPIDKENLKVDTILNFDIYLQMGNRPVLFRRKDHPFSREILEKLIQNKSNTVMITEEDVALYEKYCDNIQQRPQSKVEKICFTPPYDDPENVEKYFDTYTNYHPVEKDTLIPGVKVKFNAYQKKNFDVNLYFGPESQRDNPDIIPDDVQNINTAIVINNDDIPLYKEYLQKISEEYSKKDSVSQKIRCSIVREDSKLVIKEVLGDPRSGDNIKKSSGVVETLLDTILDNKTNFHNLLTITTYDYYTYTHSLNVCTLSIGLGMAMKLDPDKELRDLGLGALLHDLGKSAIESSIINKPGRLTDKEFNIIKSHVIEGRKALEKDNNVLPEKAYIPLLQHHEKLSGKGYPYGLKGMQVHLLGRITGIVDVYDALTTVRPYKKAFSKIEAMRMLSEFPENYDQEVLEVFRNQIGHNGVKKI